MHTTHNIIIWWVWYYCARGELAVYRLPRDSSVRVRSISRDRLYIRRIIRNIAGQCPPRSPDPPPKRQQICLSDNPRGMKRKGNKRNDAASVLRGRNSQRSEKKTYIIIIICVVFADAHTTRIIISCIITIAIEHRGIYTQPCVGVVSDNIL